MIADVKSGATIAQEEIFGPVVPLSSDSEEEVIRIANNSVYGLSGAVWSSSTERVGCGWAAAAPRNVDLVAEAAHLCRDCGRPPLAPAGAHAALGLKTALR